MTGHYRGILSGLLTGILLLPLLLLCAFPVPVLADEAHYSADDIESWLTDKIATTEVAIDTPPSVDLDTNGEMVVEDFTFNVRGITVGLNFLRLTFDGSTSIKVAGELDVLGRFPKFWCDLEIEYPAGGQLRVASVSNLKIADYEPDLSQSDLDAIVECLNSLIDKSGLSIDAPDDKDLEGINVTGSELLTTWTSDTLYHTVDDLESTADDMANALTDKANDYLGADTADWSVDVVIEEDTAVEIGLDFSLCGKDVSLDMEFSFSGLTASFDDATLSVGTKTVTFSGSGDISSSAYVPAITMANFELNDDHPGLQ
ncbi:MAG: hypothetical protein ACOC9B_01935, partial [Chloroflexota bacterium]